MVALRLHETIAAVAPIDGVSVKGQTATISFNGATQPQIDAANAVLASFDWSQAAEDAWLYAKTKASVVSDLPSKVTNGLLMQATIAVAVDEINTLRQWVESFKAAVAAATSLANLQTRVAALSAMPDRTLAQAKTAIQNKINSGAVD